MMLVTIEIVGEFCSVDFLGPGVLGEMKVATFGNRKKLECFFPSSLPPIIVALVFKAVAFS